VGSYSLEFSYIGYTSIIQADIIIRPERITSLSIQLQPAVFESETITVTSSYFSKQAEQPVSITNFSREEIRRSPGSAGDVSRIMFGLPSLAKVNDQSNSLIVRGGSPVENSFYIDHIEIPNINHYPAQGSTGGPIGIIHADFIQDVDFYSGGFSSVYGDRLSSIMDISLREGNQERFEGQLDLNLGGFGGVLEGPLPRKKGSWMISVRRSYLDMLIKMVDTGTSLAPEYGDIQSKIVYDINAHHKITLLGLLADSQSSSDKDIAEENAMRFYGNQNYYQGTVGLAWQAIWAKRGYSRTVLSYNMTHFGENGFETASDNLLTDNQSTEQIVNLSNLNHYQINPTQTMEFGLGIKKYFSQYDTYYGESIDQLGQTIPPLIIDLNASDTKYSAFVNYVTRPWTPLTLTLGVRAEYFTATKQENFSPRLSFSYQITDRTAINGAAGIYYQHLPLNLMVQNQDNTKLKHLRSEHLVLGLSHLLTENTKISLEAYSKSYQNFPLDSDQAGLFIIDEILYNYGFYTQHEHLNDYGQAYTNGLELILQKKLAKDFYGMATATYFRTQYLADDGIWRNRVYDNKYLFSIEGGYKPDHRWEFSLRWIYAGGIPFTPFDLQASEQQNRGIFDQGRINADRLPAYHTLNIRFDRRFHFSKSNIVLYFSIWNVYNQKNIASYYWNSVENRQDTIYQMGFLPIFGVEYEF
jgi:hypothetical protein